VPKGLLRLPIASGEGPAPTITISEDDWQLIEQAYGVSLSIGAKTEMLSVTQALADSYQRTAEPVAEAEKLIKAYDKAAEKFSNAMLRGGTSDAGAYAQALVERHFQGVPLNGSTRLFHVLESVLPSFHGACNAALKELEELRHSAEKSEKPLFDVRWQRWVSRLAKILKDHDLPATVRKDGEKPSFFVALVRELQKFLPPKCKVPYANSALPTAISRALRVK
jgi:hypothetical protein